MLSLPVEQMAQAFDSISRHKHATNTFGAKMKIIIICCVCLWAKIIFHYFINCKMVYAVNCRLDDAKSLDELNSAQYNLHINRIIMMMAASERENGTTLK